MVKMVYETPEVKSIEVLVEAGYVLSLEDGNLGKYWDGGESWELD
jgi:hypothetical protein